MPRNSYLGQRLIVTDVNASALQIIAGVPTYVFAPTDAQAMVRNIPHGGAFLLLPENPSDGEWYAFANIDGSASAANPILIQVPASSGATIRGTSQVPQPNPFGWGKMVFDDASNSWGLALGVGNQLGPEVLANNVSAFAANGFATTGPNQTIVEVAFTPHVAGEGGFSTALIQWWLGGSLSAVQVSAAQLTFAPSGPTVVIVQDTPKGEETVNFAGSIKVGDLVPETTYIFKLQTSPTDTGFTIGNGGSSPAQAASIFVQEVLV